MLEWELTLPAHALWEVALPAYGPSAGFLLERAGTSSELRLGAPAVALPRASRILAKAEEGAYAITPLRLPAGVRLSSCARPPAWALRAPGRRC